MTSWELWRQDEHGHEFRVRAFDDYDAAERARDELIPEVIISTTGLSRQPMIRINQTMSCESLARRAS